MLEAIKKDEACELSYLTEDPDDEAQRKHLDGLRYKEVHAVEAVYLLDYGYRYIHPLGTEMAPDEYLQVIHEKTEEQGNPHIVKALDLLTKEELIQHAKEIVEVKLKELSSLHELKCFRRKPRRNARNVIDVRWVMKWKIMDSVRRIKGRMTVRGFKDRDESALETFAGTASRSDQRVVDSVSALEPDWVSFSIDVSQAFAKGMSFDELAEEKGEPARQVEFQLAGADLDILRKIPGFSDYDPAHEVLEMTKPTYGPKDAPRAWRRKLHKVLTSWKPPGRLGRLR